MKTLKTVLLFGILGIFLFQNPTHSQDSPKKIKTLNPELQKPQKVSKTEVLKRISSNTKTLRKNLSGSWILQEDFESGIFPPTGWSITFGAIEWQQAFYSGYGTGNYSTFYENWNCNYSNNEIYSPTFGPTQSGDKLIFDYAYAPYDDGNVYYDDLEIYYYDVNSSQYISLVYYTGDNLQTSPGTTNYFEPAANEWGTKIIDLPPDAEQIYFKSWEGCGNNLYIDNIRVGQYNANYDASVEKVWAKGKLALSYGVPDTVYTLIKNTGNSLINNLKVYLNISGTNNLVDSITIPSLNIGDTMQVGFRGFIPVLSGFSNVTVSLPDDDDNGNNIGTYITQTNSNTMRYVDSNCCNAGVGWIGENSFLTRYNMSGTGQIRNVNIKMTDDAENIGQIVYAVVLDANNNLVGKSSHYKIKASDLATTKSFLITDPKPVIVTNSYYYVGIAQTQYSGGGYAFAPQQFNYDPPARPNANYGSGLGPVGSNVGLFEFPREHGQNYAIESVVGAQATLDAGISDLGLTYDQYFTSTTITPVGRVFNAGTGTVTFNVRRTINPGGYSSTKSVSGLTAGSNASVTYDPWTFTPGTIYTIRDSMLTVDGNNANNQMTSTITPRIAKQLCVLWQQQKDRDSLVRSILADGRYANNFDTVRMNYTGSYRPWKIVFACFKEGGTYMPWVRDSMKSFIDNSTTGNKKSLVVFGDKIAMNSDNFGSPADTVFFRQYLKSAFLNDDWAGIIPASQNKFRGIGFFDGITQDSVSDPYTPELIKPVNGGSAAFKPKSVTGNNNDSCNAVSFSNSNFNTFYGTNLFSSFRASRGSLRGPVLVYTKIIDWIQSVNTGVKVLDLTLLIEGFYDQSINVMTGDTVRVYLRNQSNPFAIVDSAKGYLNASGIGSFIFNNASNGVNYYLHIKHRNAVETWSKTPQSFSSNHLNYNFTTAANKSYGDNLKLQGSKWVVFEGDQNQDGIVDAVDIINIYNDATNVTSGYVRTDVNGDDIVDVGDLLIAYNNSTQVVGAITPLTPPQILAKKGIVVDNSQIPEIKTTDDIMDDFKIDNDIYEQYKNVPNKNFRLPDFISRKEK